MWKLSYKIMRNTDPVIREYILYNISHKEVTGRSWRNRKASDFYRYLRGEAKRYNITLMQAFKHEAYLYMRYINLRPHEL